MKLHFTALALLASIMPAFAGVIDSETDATVTTTPTCPLAQNPGRQSLSIDASAAAANIGYCEVPLNGPGCTPAIGSVGTTTIPAGSAPYYWRAQSAPVNGFCFVAASGSQPVTIRQGTN